MPVSLGAAPPRPAAPDSLAVQDARDAEKPSSKKMPPSSPSPGARFTSRRAKLAARGPARDAAGSPGGAPPATDEPMAEPPEPTEPTEPAEPAASANLNVEQEPDPTADSPQDEPSSAEAAVPQQDDEVAEVEDAAAAEDADDAAEAAADELPAATAGEGSAAARAPAAEDTPPPVTPAQPQKKEAPGLASLFSGLDALHENDPWMGHSASATRQPRRPRGMMTPSRRPGAQTLSRRRSRRRCATPRS